MRNGTTRSAVFALDHMDAAKTTTGQPLVTRNHHPVSCCAKAAIPQLYIWNNIILLGKYQRLERVFCCIHATDTTEPASASLHAADLLFEVITRLYQLRSTILTTNKPSANGSGTMPASSRVSSGRLVDGCHDARAEGGRAD